jgi:Skp family chaperone for outer membrane proteins
MQPKARELAMKELNQLKYKLINWQQYAEQAYQYKMESLLFPFKQRMVAALQEVIKEQKYTYVLNAQRWYRIIMHNRHYWTTLLSGLP